MGWLVFDRRVPGHALGDGGRRCRQPDAHRGPCGRGRCRRGWRRSARGRREGNRGRPEAAPWAGDRAADPRLHGQRGGDPAGRRERGTGDPRGGRLGIRSLGGRGVRAVRERPRLQGQLRHRGPQRPDRLCVHERLPAHWREGDRDEGQRADPVRARRPAGDVRLLRVGGGARGEDRRRRARLVQRPVPAPVPQGRDHLLGPSGQQQSRRLDGLRCRHVPGARCSSSARHP